MSLLSAPENEKKKIRIIGQGLAGTILALLLDELGYDVVIADDGHCSSSSVVAAGMWNPVSFKKLHASWLADQLIPAAYRVYEKLEKKLDARFFFPTTLIRIFPDVRSVNEWDERSVHPELKEFMGDDLQQVVTNNFDAPFGIGTVKSAGWLNTRILLDAAKIYFGNKQRLIIAEVNANQHQEWINNGDIVIQCTGWKLLSGGGFDWLPVLKNKGELLTVKIPNLDTKHMFNFGKFIVPLGDRVYRLGATYELNPTHLEPTEEAKTEMMKDLESSLLHIFEVLHHDTGFRPTVPDRKPVIGFSAESPRSGVINGFGSKGVLLIPYFAEVLIQHLLTGQSISREVNFSRYISRFRL